MFSNFFLKSFRILLLPFALIYWLVIGIRNWLYNKKIIPSASFAFPLICVGNLAVGGTGKSPMVEYLVRLLKDQYKVATLSRGYKRRTKGYALANKESTALEIGDEPMQFHVKFPDVPVAVGEERLDAIPQLLHDRPETAVARTSVPKTARRSPAPDTLSSEAHELDGTMQPTARYNSVTARVGKTWKP